MTLREWWALRRAVKAFQDPEAEPGPDLGIRPRHWLGLKRLGDWLHNPLKYEAKWKRRRERRQKWRGIMGIGNPKRIGGRLPNGYKPEKARGKGNSAAATTFATGGSLAGIIIWARATFGDSLPWPIEADVGLGAGLTAAANWVAAWFLNRRKHNI